MGGIICQAYELMCCDSYWFLLQEWSWVFWCFGCKKEFSSVSCTVSLRNRIVRDPLEVVSKLTCMHVDVLLNVMMMVSLNTSNHRTCVCTFLFLNWNRVSGVSKTSWCLELSYLLLCSSRTVPPVNLRIQCPHRRIPVKAGTFGRVATNTTLLGIPLSNAVT